MPSHERLRPGVLAFGAVWPAFEAKWSGREDSALRIRALQTFEMWAETFLDGDGLVAAPYLCFPVRK